MKIYHQKKLGTKKGSRREETGGRGVMEREGGKGNCKG